jgi:hypothetical protein
MTGQDDRKQLTLCQQSGCSNQQARASDTERAALIAKPLTGRATSPLTSLLVVVVVVQLYAL